MKLLNAMTMRERISASLALAALVLAIYAPHLGRAWAETVTFFAPPPGSTIDDANLTGDANIEDAVVTGNFTVEEWPSSGIAGFTGPGQLESATPGTDYVQPAPIMLFDASTGQMIPYGSGVTDASAIGTLLTGTVLPASASGDTIYQYSNATVAASVYKNGVSLWIAPGVTLAGTSGTTVIGTTGAPFTFKVFGAGDIVGNNAYGVVAGEGSVLTIVANRIATTGSGNPAVYSGGGVINFDVANDIYSQDYDGVWMDGLGTGSICGTADIIDAGNDCLEMTDGALYIRARVLRAGASNISHAVLATAGLLDVTCEEATTRDATNNRAVSVSGVTAGSILRIGRCDRQIRLGGGVRLVGTALNTSSVASLDSLVLTSAATVEDVTVTSHSGVTNSVSAASTQTLTVNGTLDTNKARSNITLAGPGSATIAGTVVRSGGTTLGAGVATANGNAVDGSGGFATWDAEISAVRGLTSAADKLPYFTGSGTAALADYPSVARTFDAATTVAAQRSTLGVNKYYLRHNSATIFSPAASTTYYLHPYTLNTSAALAHRLRVPIAGTITGAWFNIYISGGWGGATTSTASFLVNAAGGANISTAVTANAEYSAFANTGLSTAVSAGDLITTKWVTPAWGGPPTNLIIEAVYEITY